MQEFNKLLDKSSELREQLGPGAEALSLQASLDGLWQRTKRRLDAKDHQQQPMASAECGHRLASTYSAAQARDVLLQWHMANIEFANATRLPCLSMLHWDLDDAHEHQGAHVFLPGQHWSGAGRRARCR